MRSSGCFEINLEKKYEHEMNGISRERLRQIANQTGIAVTAVTTAEPFDGLADILEERVLAGRLAGLDWFTVDRARFSADPRNLHSGGRSIISVGIPYWQPAVEPPRGDKPRGQIARYAWGRDYHKTLKQRMKALLAALERELGRTVEARLLVDTARIVDRAAAARSGLGWYGKNTMILVPGHGSWVMLGDMIVDVEIEPDTPLRSKCGRCSACISQCPTGALLDTYTLDTPRCISFLTIELRGPIPVEIRQDMGNWVFGCDVCQEVCPYTKAAAPIHDPAFQPVREENAFPLLGWLLEMSDEEFRSIYQGTAVMRAKRSGLARNAAVALGNIGGVDDLELLERVVSSHDLPLVRGHAAWAMARIDQRSSEPFLVRRMTREPDDYVRAEIASAVAA
jgi:epoxyqueuosine reductase